MGTLSTEQLIHGVKNGRPIAPFSIQDDIIEKYIELIKLKQMILKTDSQEAKLLAMLLRKSLDFVTKEEGLALSHCEIGQHIPLISDRVYKKLIKYRAR